MRCPSRTTTSWSRTVTRRRSGCTGWSPTAPASPYPTQLSSCGSSTGPAPSFSRRARFRRDGWTFTGWGRASTDDNGRYTFSTLTPGAEAGKAAFFAITVFGRGVTNRLFTRAYLPGDEAALQADPLLASLDAEERSTLIAVADERGVCLRHQPARGAGDCLSVLPRTLKR